MSNRREGGHCATHKRNHQDGCLDCSIAREDALQQRLTAADERIDQLTKPQGVQVACMPVERCYDVRAKMIIAFNEAKKTGGDLDDALDAAYKSALRYSPSPLSAELPAPVAVNSQAITDLRHIFDSNKGADGTLVISKKLAAEILNPSL
jgi:hypothetical protein